ncbi:putative F-box protein At1g67390 [Phaseolus vulgaris]|uniref:putative F-box protein At1g67390 n=1 Tax=Phaseolus vulgaris TaxID=3885 RepID=UPI0035CC0BCC
MTTPEITNVRRRNNEELDIINQLPGAVLSQIISSLSIDEAVRSSVLSKQWKPLWKQTSCLDFDGRRMVNPLSQLNNSLPKSMSFDPIKVSQYAEAYDEIVNQVLHLHLGDLISCRFRHFRQHLCAGDVEKWVEFVIMKKGLSSLNLECDQLIQDVHHIYLDTSPDGEIEFKPRIFSNLYSLELTNYTLNIETPFAFESCEKLRILKLKKIVMEDATINGILDKCLCLEKFSLTKSSGFKKLNIMNSSLKYLKLKLLMLSELNTSQSHQLNQSVLKAQDIFENCSDLLGSRTMNIFQNLLLLSIDLDLNNIREALSLSFILKSCVHLKNLEITIPDDKSNDGSHDCSLPFPNSTFWERKGVYYNCINYKLEYATIKGFKGKEQEVKFVKHIITNANRVKKITIICDSVIVDEAKDLLSILRTSPYLSIILELKKELVDIAGVQDVVAAQE